MFYNFKIIRKKNFFPIFPIGKNKKPLVKWSDTSTHIKNTDDLANVNPIVGAYALVTGKPSNVMVVDIDNKSGVNGHKTLMEVIQKLDIPKEDLMTFSVKTPNNGIHLYFKYKEGLKNVANIAPGVDIRTDGGYIVAPNSCIKRKDGKDGFYEVKYDREILDMPQKLFDFFKSKGKKETKKISTKEGSSNTSNKFHKKVGVGERDQTLFKYLCSLGRFIRNRDDLYLLASAYNKKYLNPPLEEKEVIEKVESSIKKQNGNGTLDTNNENELQQDEFGIHSIWYKKEIVNDEEVLTRMKTYLTDFNVLNASISRNIDTDEQIIEIKIKNQFGKYSTIKGNARTLLNDPKVFREALGIDYNFYSNGKAQMPQLLKLKQWIVKYFVVNDIENFKTTGIRKINDEYVLVTNNGILYKDGTWDTTIKADNILHDIDFSDIADLQAEEAATLAGYLFTFNTDTVIYNTLGCAVSQMLNTYARESKKDKLPVLFDIGESNAGKTKAQNIVKLLFNNTNGSFGFNVTTGYAIQKAMGETYLPIFVDEIKPSQDGVHKKKQLGQLIRTATEDHFNLKGTQSQSFKTYETFSTLVLTGEDGTNETAAVNRTNTVRFSRINFSETGKKSINYLCNTNEGNLLLRKLSRHLYLHVLNKWNPTILEKRYEETKANKNYNLDKLKDDRIQKTAIYTLLGFEILWDVFTELGVNLKLFGFNKENAAELIISNLIEELNDGLENTLAEYEKILQDIDHIAGNVDTTFRLRADFDYKDINGLYIAIIIPSIWDKLERYYKTNKSESIPLDKNTFTKTLRNSKYFNDYKNVKFASYVEERDGSIHAAKRAKKAFILKKEELKKLSFENLIEQQIESSKIIKLKSEYIQSEINDDIFNI